ncbi:DNA integrity scanning protein DisA nucleotide-binding domain protein [Candidatus Poseidoniaceae archaeon]|jgi:DNA integrity scanning protein DisA with diadenylate cyclase activity|nr:DNA integrity scanning protein DisA nucleotide-binding domain protein [Candidatus Poseidoniaceae archaeon]MDC3339713.1 DNA integrity scanning protein DisA nucleotide-binding domain protein [bacterium]
MVDLPNLVASAIANDKSGFSAAVLLSNNSRTVRKIREVVPSNLGMVTMTSSSKVSDSLKEDNLEVEMLEDSLSSQGLSVLNNLHDIILQGLGEGRFKSNERILAILGEPMNGVIVIEASSLTSNRLAIMAQEHQIDIEILARIMELARHIGGRGREGHAVGALFAIGSVPKLRRYSTALVLNPFKGHSDSKKNIADPSNHETLAEFAWLDGAILFNSKGIASDAGRYVQVPSGINPKPGEGGRHLAARSISQLADAIAICVSSSGVITLYSKGREKYRVRLS